MPGVFECPICEHYYDTEGRKPLCLPCGHTVCRTCLLRCVSTPPKKCPMCRGEWRGAVDDLPVCYQLIPGRRGREEDEESSPNPGVGSRCGQHGYAFDFWCSSCHFEVCRKCLLEKHKACKTVLVEELVHSTSPSEVVAASNFLKKSLTADMAATKTAASTSLESLVAVNRLVTMASVVIGQLEAEQVHLSVRRDEIQTMTDNVTSVPLVWTSQFKRQMLRWATEYHCNLETPQPPRDFSPLQLQKLAELCVFAKSFQFPRRQQQEQQKGWFSRWW